MALPQGLSQNEISNVGFEDGLGANGAVLTDSGATWDGDNPATYGAQHGSPFKWAGGAPGTSGGTVTYYFDPGSGWTPNEEAVWNASLALWSSIANVMFRQVTAAGAAKLTLYRDPSTSGPAGQAGGAYTSLSHGFAPTGSTSLPAAGSAYVSIQTGNPGAFFNFDGGFATLFAGAGGGGGIDTVLHELGHVLGLSHSGPYNGSVASGTQQFSPVDTLQYSIMSYIAPTDTSAKYYDQSPTPGTNWGISGNYYREPTTPQVLDIAAVQQLYGASTTAAFAGGQTYGFNCNIEADVRPFYDFTVNTAPVVTITNRGTGNTLDLSGYGMACTVNLNPGTFSSVAGLTNNVGIAFGTRLDAAVGGAGDDVFYENADGDTINGGGGTNTVVLQGNLSGYSMARTPDGAVTVMHNGTSIKDMLSNVATLQFADGATVQADAIPLCFVRGTRIAVPDGHELVERLRPGTAVLTAFGEARPVRWIGRRSYAGPFLASNPGARPVRVHAGAIADGVPVRDLLVSPRHALFLDGLLVPAEALVNGATITRCGGTASVEYFHVELDGHDVLLAEGCPAESFADIGTRGLFHNAADFRALHPDAPATTPLCAELAEQGEAFGAVRRRLDARAGLALPDPSDQAGPLAGNVDEATHDRVAGWARAEGAAPLRLEVLDNGRVVGRVVANAMRADVRDAGLGDGRCGFVLARLALDQQEPHCIVVRRASDSAVLGERVLAAAPRPATVDTLRAMLADMGKSATGAAAEHLATLLEVEARRLRRSRAA